ncbi:hypothetical protein DSECCO2_141100 [anaerobic digester metagenome]
MVDSKNKKCRSAKNKTLSGRLVWSAVIPIGLSFLYSYVVLSIFMSLSFFLRLVGNGWGCDQFGNSEQELIRVTLTIPATVVYSCNSFSPNWLHPVLATVINS